jgi:hypothetical protein
MTMLRKILRALKAMLQAFVRGIDGVWRYVAGTGGGDVMVDDLVDTGTPEEKAASSAEPPPPLEEHDLRVDRRRDAALVRTYCMRTVMTGERPALEPCLPRVIKEWLGGLGAGEIKMLADATADQVFQHVGTGPYLQGCHRVQRLRPLTLPTKTGPGTIGDGPRQVNVLRRALG